MTPQPRPSIDACPEGGAHEWEDTFWRTLRCKKCGALVNPEDDIPAEEDGE